LLERLAPDDQRAIRNVGAADDPRTAVVLDRRVADEAEHGVLHLVGLRTVDAWVEPIVAAHERQLATAHPALRVDVVEVGLCPRATGRAEVRHRAADRRDVAELDLRVAHTRRIRVLGGAGAGAAAGRSRRGAALVTAPWRWGSASARGRGGSTGRARARARPGGRGRARAAGTGPAGFDVLLTVEARAACNRCEQSDCREQ